jgi:hypothetical protein
MPDAAGTAPSFKIENGRPRFDSCDMKKFPLFRSDDGWNARGHAQ